MAITEAPVVPLDKASQANGKAEPELTGRERRESERAIAYWEKKIEKLGKSATVAALDLADMNTVDWSHRFVIAVDPVVGTLQPDSRHCRQQAHRHDQDHGERQSPTLVLRGQD